ncbi:hypothetical protein M0811_07233 [Anaeramoeba ignava]|uniref:Uncharacterized protein n=1 Tax=Anaeramoeba ignava TaxID=1746090 RepID=A0A9Q0LMR2_ANAIG|nr:hypothetical protein M0811_07233 [Anaeramoeba ignava]
MMFHFEGFLKFSHFILFKFNGKITQEKAQQTTIDTILGNERKDVYEYYQHFKKFWNINTKEVKYIQVLDGIKSNVVIPEIEEEMPLEVCLPNSQKEKSFLPVLIQQGVQIHNQIVKKMQKAFPRNENDENQPKKTGKQKLDFSNLLIDYYSPALIHFNLKEFENSIINNPLDFKFLESYIEQKLDCEKDKTLLVFEPINFHFADEKQPILETQFLEKYWNQKKLPIQKWKQIEEEIAKHRISNRIMKLIEYLVLGLKNINIEKKELEKLSKMSIMEFIQTKLKCSFFDDILALSPSFTRFAKMKHLLFINFNLPHGLSTSLANLPQKFQEKLNFDFEDNLKKINMYELIDLVENLIKNITEQFDENYSLRKILLNSIEDQKSKIFTQINDFIPKKLKLKNLLSFYENCQIFLKNK